MKFATLIKHLMDFIIQYTDHKYYTALLRNSLLYVNRCNLFPHALFLHARLQIRKAGAVHYQAVATLQTNKFCTMTFE